MLRDHAVTPGSPYTLGEIVTQAFGGLQWLFRNPRAAIQMFAFLMMLGMPAGLMVRRRRWLTSVAGEGV